MADWVRNTIMLTILAVWALYMTISLAHNREPSPVLWGVVPTAYIGLNPTWKKGNKDGQS